MKGGNSVYQVGDTVFYKGDTKDNRIWTITKTGDKYLSIIPNEYDSHEDPLKVVTVKDIEKPNIFDYNPTPINTVIQPYIAPIENTIPLQQDIIPQQHNFEKQPYMVNAPIIKVITNGNDMSTTDNPNENSSNTHNNEQTKIITPTKDENKINFNEPIIIKKEE
jgi:hypothetical protein